MSKRNHKLWEKKNQLKQEVAHLNEVIHEQSSQYTITASKTPQEKWIIEATKTWFGEVVSEGARAIKDAVKILEHIQGVEEMLHDLIASLNQEVNTLKEILGDWN